MLAIDDAMDCLMALKRRGKNWVLPPCMELSVWVMPGVEPPGFVQLLHCGKEQGRVVICLISRKKSISDMLT